MVTLKLLMILIISLIMTPIIMKLSIKFNIIDKPDERKVHKKIIPRMGGLSIVISFIAGLFIFKIWEYNYYNNLNYYLVSLGILTIVFLGILDDKFMLGSKIKFLVQFIAATLVVFGGIEINVINIPFITNFPIDIGIFSIPFSILWIIGITNAINLIDGLDGLSSGITIISLFSILTMSFLMNDIFITTLCMILIVSILGFLKYNFYPAKVFMGDTGSLFLGFMIGIISLVSYKNIAVYSILVPLFILAVPIGDTLLAIVRRLINRKPIGSADKSHLHHCLMERGLSHRSTVILIYLISICFNIGALLLSTNVLWISIIVFIIAVILLEVLIETTPIIKNNYSPIKNIYKKFKIRGKERKSI